MTPEDNLAALIDRVEALPAAEKLDVYAAEDVLRRMMDAHGEAGQIAVVVLAARLRLAVATL